MTEWIYRAPKEPVEEKVQEGWRLDIREAVKDDYKPPCGCGSKKCEFFTWVPITEQLVINPNAEAPECQ